VVPYAPGTLEARGSKNGNPVMISKRETTGPAARLVIRPDREQISADGEDVAMFGVEVQDAQGRTVPITDHEVTFRTSGSGKLIGTGNGDPTDHTPDKGISRKAFCGFCMALVQSTKQGGEITVEASSPGLAPATVTISAKPVELRPQVAVWEREVPKGSGITGLWRPVPPPPGPDSDLIAMFLGANGVFTLHQEGSQLSGSVEGSGGFFGGDDVPVPIVEGRVDGDRVTFKSGINTYEGRVNGDHVELQRSVHLPWSFPPAPKEDPRRPAIGPAPDGSDPSIDPSWHMPSGIPVVLRRVER
jgi:beta-galactosidase